MSLDIFVQKFDAGDAVVADADAIRAILGPYRREGVDSILHFKDGTADLYGWDNLEKGFMINHAGGREVWNIVVRVAREARLTVIPVGCPPAVTSRDDIEHLPPKLSRDVVIVESGGDLLSIVRGEWPVSESAND